MKAAKAYAKMCNSLNPYNYVHDAPEYHGGYLLQDIEPMIAELGDFEEMDEDYNPFGDAEIEANTRRQSEDPRECVAKIKLANFGTFKKDLLVARKEIAACNSKNKWVLVDGKKIASDCFRRDRGGRLEDDMDSDG